MPKTGAKKLEDGTKPSLREHILNIADELFYTEGIRATGVDTIIAKSGVAKSTLYRYFPSKDDLVVAYLEQRNQRFWDLLEAEIAKYPLHSVEKLLGVFKWLDELLAKPECLGCPFIITTAEYGELDYPGHQIAVKHKEAVLARLTQLAEANVNNPRQLAAVLLLLIDGAFVQRRLFGKVLEVSLAEVAQELISKHDINSL
ncbi:TetR family transcriptional regulator protein [Calothrix sp. NIES-4071]|nr:TetR family transcriptional regulator protein [Calothrix sp. NIES-4071]BAZ63140.1 TetR family transcriptional regulator protein [Calothrix sp. NIES-4105]